MSKAGLKFLAAVLTTGIVVVPFLGLDNLPRGLQQQIDAERKTYATARTKFQRARSEVESGLRAEPALFRARNMQQVLPERLRRAETALAEADKSIAALVPLREANRRQDREEAERLLKEARERRALALGEATAVQAEANRWLELKRSLPRLEQEYQAVRAADFAALEATVRKAQSDWPEKQDDLEAHLAAVRAIPERAESAWNASEPARRLAAEGRYDALDYAALLGAVEAIRGARKELPAKSQELAALTEQLYTGWDKVLVDMEVRRAGETRDYQQKIRTVRTKNGQVTSEEKWIEVPRARYEAMERNLGMAIEHKDRGKYDSEAERVAQPAGFAYMAPPSEGRNQYGYWERRDGQSFWVWYGQYALLRDLLFNRDYRAPDSREYEHYRSDRRSGRTYYGGEERSAPKYGTSGSSTQSRYSGSEYARRGGFGDSEYASRGGGYRSSEYASRGYRRERDAVLPGGIGGARGSYRPAPPSGWKSYGGWSSAGRTFGRGAGRILGGGGRSFGGRSFGGGGGRSFGGGGGRRR